MPALLNAEEAATRARIHPTTFRRWINEGRGPIATRLGRKLFVREDRFEAWLEECSGCAPVVQQAA